MFLSKSCIYGIQATIQVAVAGGETYVSINKLADQLNISFHFLTKVLQLCTSAGILKSYRGPKGGVSLNKSAQDVTLFDLIKAIDGSDVFTECMLGLPGCGSAEPCPAHEHWIEVRSRFVDIANSVTLSDLAAKAGELHVRIADITTSVQAKNGSGR